MNVFEINYYFRSALFFLISTSLFIVGVCYLYCRFSCSLSFDCFKARASFAEWMDNLWRKMRTRKEENFHFAWRNFTNDTWRRARAKISLNFEFSSLTFLPLSALLCKEHFSFSAHFELQIFIISPPLPHSSCGTQKFRWILNTFA